jgi:nucleoside-diphosphate-sugar epimerase
MRIYCAKRAASSTKQLEATASFFGKTLEDFTTHPDVTFIEVDLLDGMGLADQLKSLDSQAQWTFVHAAAVIDLNKGSSGSNPNHRITEEVLLAAAELSATHYTHISSIAVLGGNAPLGDPEELGPNDFQPNRRKRGLSTYAKSKIESELSVWRSVQEGLSVSIVRPGVIIGIGPSFMAPQELWVRLWKDKMPFSADGGSAVVDVRDVAEMTVRMHLNKVQDHVVAVGGNMDYHSMLQSMAAGLGVERKFYQLKKDPWLARFRALHMLSYVPGIGKFFEPAMRTMLFSKTSYDGSSGQNLLAQGYRPTASSFTEMGAAMRGLFEKEK